jgi:threonine/homoserine/homoserine lactone efflux protein
MDWLARLEAPQNALSILTAMITPAVLISACGALIFSTSTRLGRVIDRVRVLSEKFQELAAHPEKDDMAQERQVLIFTQLDRQTSRARLIQRAMTAYYTALGIFVASTVAIAIVSAAARTSTWIAVVLGLVGAIFMLYGSVLLIVESRMALAAIMSEMDFVWKVSQKYAGKDVTTQAGGPFTWLGRKIQ